MKIAITGATGQLGQLVIQELLKQHHAETLVGLVRDTHKAKILEQYGIEIRSFDYAMPVDQLAQQLQGIQKLLLISSSEIGQRVQQHKNVIDAAKIAGVALLVYTSVLNADQSPLALADEHVATEVLIKASGIPYVLLRNNWYSENYAMSLPQSIEHGVILGATHHGKISSASRVDYASAAATVLSQDQHINQTYELAGDESYTLDDVATWATALSGKPVVYQDLMEQDFATRLIQAGVPEDFARILANSDESVAQFGMYSQSKDLQKLIGRQTTPMLETIKVFLA
jgi:NAD(P)H dehydrogenase (quinone)